MLVVRCLSFRVSILLWLQFLSLLHTIVDGIHRVLRLFNHILLSQTKGRQQTWGRFFCLTLVSQFVQ